MSPNSSIKLNHGLRANRISERKAFANQPPKNSQNDSEQNEEIDPGTGGGLPTASVQSEEATEVEIIPVLPLLLKFDPGFGLYTCAPEAEFEDLKEVLMDCNVNFTLDPAGSGRLSQAGHRTFVFGRQHPHYLREILDEYEVKVRIDPSITLPEQTFVPPVNQLLTLGDPREKKPDADFAALGIGREHASELIRMATDDLLHLGPSSSPIVWGPIYAWRALAHFRVEEAIVPLLGLLKRIDEYEDDWIAEELPEVFAQIGPASIIRLTSYLSDPAHGHWARVAAASALGKIGEKHADSRTECVRVLSAQLEHFTEQDESFNAFLVSPLIDLHAIEAVPLMEKAFSLGKVDESVPGDWEDVQIELGLKTKRERPRKPNSFTKKFDPLRKKLGLTTSDNDYDEDSPEIEPGFGVISQPYIAPPKVGRNDPCPCGSGKKYKKCCGK